MENEDLIIQATGKAKTILSGDFAVFFLVGVMAIEWWLASLLPQMENYAALVKQIVVAASILWLAPLGVIINWFISFGGVETQDAEFLAARKSLMMSFVLWLAVNALNLLLLNYRGWLAF